MTRNKPRGRTPSLIGSTNGRPVRIEVKKRCACQRCKEDIEAGEDCFGIPKLGTAFSNKQRFCALCFKAVLDQTRRDLSEIEKL